MSFTKTGAGTSVFNNVIGSVKTTITGTPLFTQLSPSATSSAVGAFSLRAVNGLSPSGTAKAVQVTQYTLLEVPPVALTQNTFTATGTFNGVTNGQYTALASSRVSTSEVYRCFDKNPGTRGLTVGTDYTIGTGVFVGSASTVDSTSSTYNGAWVQIQIPSAINAISYSVDVNSALTLTAPYTWKLFGSTTGSSGSWVVLDTRTAYTFATTTARFTLATLSAGYTYFRLAANMISPSSTAGNLGPAELIIYGYSSLVSSTQDFYADRLGNLLTAPVTGQSLANWLGGATGYVTTWYDQSGRGNHATQATAANQPVIQRATKGPGYMVNFNGTTNFLTGMSHTVLNATNFSFNVVERRTGSTSGGTATNDLTLVSCGNIGQTGKLLYLTYRNSTTSLFGSWSPELSSTISAFTSASTEPIRYTSATASSTSGRRVYIYNDPLGNPITTTNATQTSLMSMTSGNFQIGYYVFGSSTSYYKGEIYEVLVFTQSLYDLDTSGGLITKIYQNQLGIYGT